jgi:alpha-ribazole phosphatase
MKKSRKNQGDEATTLLYLARHGQVINDGVYNGQMDVDITPLGFEQMERLRLRLADQKLSAVYSSDLLRTRRGADLIASSHGLTARHFPEFREMNFGRWQGLTVREVVERYPTDLSQWMEDLENFRIPGGESLAEARRRVMPKLMELIERHRGEEILLLCHGAVNRVILAEALQLPMAQAFRIEQDYGCLNIIAYGPTWTTVRLING